MTPAATFFLIAGACFFGLLWARRFGPAAEDLLTPIFWLVGTGTLVMAITLFTLAPT